MKTDGELQQIIARLRQRADEVRGDGFSYAGNLKSAYKRAIKRLEELAELAAAAPTTDFVEPHPNCPLCHGEGVMDSGGFTPWGAPIDIRCECTYPEPTSMNPDCLGNGGDNVPTCTG